MNKFLAVAAAFGVLTASGAASATVTFSVNGSFTGGGALTGTFSTNDAITQVTAIDLTSSTNGAFVGTTYSNLATVDAQFLPSYFRLTVGGTGSQVQITFSPPLTAAGGVIGANSFEHQAAAGNRTLTGSVARAVPEPASWAMMVLGFAVTGAAVRRRQTSRVAFA